MQIEQKANIHNRFDIEVNGKWVAYAENIVLDQMWTRLCSGSSYFNNIHFGSGTGSPAANRTSLFTHVGTKSAVNEEIIKAFPVSRWKRKITLNPEEFIGSIIREVGIAYDAPSTNLVTHAMLKDSEGNPVSITKKDTDIVTIFATVFATINDNGTVLIDKDASTNQLVNYLIGGSSFPSGTFGFKALVNTPDRLGSSETPVWTSDIPNKKRKTNLTRFSAGSANGHIQVIDFSNLFTLPIPASGIFTGHPYTGVNLGNGDGVQTIWTLPSANIKSGSLALKIAGVLANNYSQKIIYSSNPIKINTPKVIPSGNNGNGVALSSDGLVMALAHDGSPYVTTYDWLEGAWIKRPNPAILPNGAGYGVALTPDGSVMAVAYGNYVISYNWVGGAWVTRPNPAIWPTGTSRGVALSSDGLIMAVSHDGYPYITTYDWVGGAWIKRPNPAALPTGDGRAVALTPDGSVMAVAYGNYIVSYNWVGGAWVTRPNPAIWPTGTSRGVALSSDGLVMGVAHSSSPFVTSYGWVGGAWIKRPNPAVLPTGAGFGVAFTPDGSVMAVAHDGSPHIAIYDWVEATWVKRPNPSVLAISTGNAIALTPDASIVVMGHFYAPCIITYKNLPFTKITFDTPPPLAAPITADYIVDGIHKTSNFVVDVSCAIQFGEG